jgi:Zn-finger nucleic acid-binding protein
MCPVCKEPLIVFELDGVEIDRCLRCSGTWLDSGEILQLARLRNGLPDRLEAAITQAGEGRKSERPCVRCSAKMREIQVNAVDIDRCPRGHGLWFDRSEMETLIASSQGGEGGAMVRLLGELRPARDKKGD